MKIKLLLTLILLSLVSFSYGQICGTSSTQTNTFQESEEETLNQSLKKGVTSVCFNVYYHIVREDNGSGGFNPASLGQVTDKLNQAFNPHKIYVNSIGYGYIDESIYYNIDDYGSSTTEFDALVQINNHPNAINIYIVNDALDYDGSAIILSRVLVIKRDWVQTYVLSHEVGHCLNLLHTFEGTKSGTPGCAENIDGSNCSSCGDKVCDTPADAGTGTSGGYTPDMNNIMSYYLFTNHFTAGQAARMRSALNSSILQPVISESCAIPELTGTAVICNPAAPAPLQQEIFTLINGGSSVTWNVSSNLQIISSNSTSVTVSPLNDLVNGSGFIEAILPYETLRKDVWIGKPILSANYDCYNNPSHPMCGIICKTEFYHPDNTIRLNVQGETEWEATKIGNFDYHIGGNTLYIQPYQAGTIGLILRAKNVCGISETLYFMFSVSNCKKMMLTQQRYYKVYPNPSNDVVYIGLADTESQPLAENQITGELYDLTGNLKTNVQIENNQASFSVQGLNSGIYILNINIDGNIESHNIMVE